MGERSVRILPGATAANDKVTTRNNSLRVTVDPESWVNVPVYVEGEITDEVVPMQRVSITPYLDSQDAIRVSASPLNDSTYDPWRPARSTSTTVTSSPPKAGILGTKYARR